MLDKTPFTEPTISQMLKDAGYQHTRTRNSVNTGKHLVSEIATGEFVGEFTAHEAVEFLARRVQLPTRAP